LKIADENVSEVCILDNGKELRERIAVQLIHWKKLITFDRRRKFEDIKIGKSEAKGVSFLKTGYLVNETYVTNTASWVLPKPLLIGSLKKYNFFVGTQIAGSGTTIVCSNCHSAIKYYFPDDDGEALQKIKELFATSKCQLCGQIIQDSEETSTIRLMMSMLVTKFKAENG
jgi:hypothetical protein